MYPALSDLKTESDVEQKLIWPLLVQPFPDGLGLHVADVSTKLNLRRLPIGKGATRKVYFPDYLVALAGLPVLLIEAKAVGVSLDEALDEARLYAQEVNALYPHGINPCARVIACNGSSLCTAPVDTAVPDLMLQHADLVSTNSAFARLLEICRREKLQAQVDELRRRFRPAAYVRPVQLVGGLTIQNQQLPQNTFGATIVGDYGHIFNPQTREDRARIARDAYVASLRRQRFVEPIDRLIRNAVAPVASRLPALADSSHPEEIATTLRDRARLEKQVMLLVGSVGVGKSTFVDHLSLVALPRDIREQTIWLRINLNEAPVSPTMIYGWLADEIVEEMRTQASDVDFDDVAVLQKVFGPELNAFRKGPVSLLPESSQEYQTRLADRISQLQLDQLTLAKCMARYLCAGPGRLLVVVLDNCDKRTRDEQLLMFEVATWLQKEFRCLVVLPLRDVTYDLYSRVPPLDTALKHLVFRIEPPPFSEVLQLRARLALEDMNRKAVSKRTLSYQLPSGAKVVYPAEDQALYLASILRSLYAHDRFVRQVVTGLAGRDVRKALEIFLEFCTSGHIGEDQIYQIRYYEGRHVLPVSTVARVLLRMQRRFYDGNKSYLKNLVQVNLDDALPDHFVRLGILHWCHKRLATKGPAGVQGFHRVSHLISALVSLGHDANSVRAELAYLAREGCVVPEHLRPDAIGDEDLVKITSGGTIHLQMMTNPEYLAACAEDTQMSDPALAGRIAERLRQEPEQHYSRSTTARTAAEFVDYLKERANERLAAPDTYLDQNQILELRVLGEAEAALSLALGELPTRLFVGNVAWDATVPELTGVLAAGGVATKAITLPIDPSTQKNRGFAFIEPADAQSTLRALEQANLLRLRGRRLRISEANAGREEERTRSNGRQPSPASLTERLFVANLPYTLDEGQLRTLFLDHGLTPIDLFILMDRGTKRSRGIGFVSLASKELAAQAIGALNGVLVEGRRVVVRPANPRDGDAEG